MRAFRPWLLTSAESQGACWLSPRPFLSKNGRSLSAPALATLRKWQHEIRAAVKGAGDRERRHRIDELEWTTRT